MKKVGDVVPVLPVALVATVFLEENSLGTISELEVKSKVAKKVKDLASAGHHVHIPREDSEKHYLKILVTRLYYYKIPYAH